jgi:phage gp36-like protein
MIYVTRQEIERRFGVTTLVQLTDDAGTGLVNEAVLSAAVDDAEAEVHAELAGRYVTPVAVAGLPEAAAILRALVLDLLEMRLHARRPEVPDDVTKRHALVRARLADLGAGRAMLPGAAVIGPRAEITGNAAVLSRETFEGM